MTTATDGAPRRHHGTLAPTRPDPDVVWYVYVRNGCRTGLLAGPFVDQRTADTYVDPVRAFAESVDQWAHFYEFGSLRARPRPGRTARTGRLNARLGLPGSVVTGVETGDAASKMIDALATKR